MNNYRLADDRTPGANLNPLFVDHDAPIPRDWIDVDNDEKENAKPVKDMRKDWATEIDKDLDQSKGQGKQEVEDNPAQTADTEYKRSSNHPVVAAVVRQRPDTLTGARVLLKNAHVKHEGRVVAVGETEFCVFWPNNKEYTIERKSNFNN